MHYNDRINAGRQQIDIVRDLDKQFPGVEHTNIFSRYDFNPDGWRICHEWVSRIPLFDRHILWISFPFEVKSTSVLAVMRSPQYFITEPTYVLSASDSGDQQKMGCSFGIIDDETWAEIVAFDSDIENLRIAFAGDGPVDGFNIFWERTRPPQDDPAPDGVALHTPLRYLCQD